MKKVDYNKLHKLLHGMMERRRIVLEETKQEEGREFAIQHALESGYEGEVSGLRMAIQILEKIAYEEPEKDVNPRLHYENPLPDGIGWSPLEKIIWHDPNYWEYRRLNGQISDYFRQPGTNSERGLVRVQSLMAERNMLCDILQRHYPGQLSAL